MAQTLLWQNARLIDGRIDQPRAQVSILVGGERITAVPFAAGVDAVAPRRYADFLVIDGDPLHDPRQLRKLTTVYRGGVAHDPQATLARAPRSDAVQA
jgi:hypothetical protein